MINNSATAAIKRAQKESLLLRQVSEMFHTITIDDIRLHGLFINRVELSPDKSWLTIYFFTLDGLDKFQEQLEVLKLYKPSIRKGLATKMTGRYVPDLRFSFDEKFEKQQRLEAAMAKAAQDIRNSEKKDVENEDAQ